MGTNYIKKRHYSLLDQQVALKKYNNNKEIKCEIDSKKLLWYGKIRPTPLSKEYQVLLVYDISAKPKVWVMGEELEKLEEKDFPHKYDINPDKKTVRICLNLPIEFNKTKLIAKTIIPWTIEWLYFYEIWLATGEWRGGGQHPDNGEEKEDG